MHQHIKEDPKSKHAKKVCDRRNLKGVRNNKIVKINPKWKRKFNE